jgi:hypothetical protein
MKFTLKNDDGLTGVEMFLVAGVLVLLGFALVFAMFCLYGWLVMLLWNAIIPALFGLSKITFWQAVGLNILCSFLFKGGNFVDSTAQRLRERKQS